jgi:hypothetical protein
MRGKMKSDISRLTATTIKSGRTANAIGGSAWLWSPWVISAGSNAPDVVARSRTISSLAASIRSTSAP